MKTQRTPCEALPPRPIAMTAVGPPERWGGVVTGAMVQRHFPGAWVWRGNHTESWWAAHPALDHLVEAASPAELAFALRAALTPAGRAASGPNPRGGGIMTHHDGLLGPAPWEPA
jgi:hypothetical protein